MAEQGTKRTAVDIDGLREIQISKKPRVEQNAGLKEKILYFIGLSYYSFLGKFKIPEDQWRNINMSIQLMNSVATAYTIVRQTKRGKGANALDKARATGPKITIGDKTFTATIRELTEEIERVALIVGLQFNNPTAERGAAATETNWYGIAGPYMNMLCGFGLRLKELRLGHHEVAIDRKDGVERFTPISRLGLNRSHAVLLEGCRFPPEKRASMMQSVGPLTALISYLRSNHPYDEKPRDAVLRAYSHVPAMDDILNVIKGKTFKEVGPVLNCLGDIGIMTTTRNATRAFPPPAVFFALLLPYSDGIKKILEIPKAAGPSETTAGSVPKPTPMEAAPIIVNEKLKYINFSGAPAFCLYKMAEKDKTGFTFTSNMDQNQVSQVIFHSWFGTFREDFGVLSRMTGVQTWYNRNELKDGFKRMNTEGRATKVSFVPLRCFSKMASANLTGSLSTQGPIMSANPVFSGYRTRLFNMDLLEQARRGTGKGSISITDMGGVLHHLNKLRSFLANEILEDKGDQQAGTTEWFDAERLNAENIFSDSPVVIPANIGRIEETGDYFI